MTSRVAILISGGGSNMVALAQDMLAKGYASPTLVLSNRPDAGGIEKARQMKIDAQAIDHKTFDDRVSFDMAIDRALRDAQIDVVCLAGFMRIFTPEFTQLWDGKMLNIHPSLLPLHKGLNTHARALEAGDKEHGCTVHQVTADLDDGPVLGQARIPVLPDDTPDSLAARVLPFEHQLYPAVLRRFLAGDVAPLYLTGR